MLQCFWPFGITKLIDLFQADVVFTDSVRAGCPCIAIVVTDGESNTDTHRLDECAQRLKVSFVQRSAQ